MAYEEYDRLKAKPALSGVTTPVSDIAMIFLNDVEPMLDKNVRLGAHYAIDKQLLDRPAARRLRHPDRHAEAPEYDGLRSLDQGRLRSGQGDELLAASGYSPEKPIKFKIQTTRGFKPKDYEMIQAIVGMWRKVGIEAEIEVYEIAKHYELRATDTLAPAAFYNWGNAIGDPSTSTGFAMFGPSPHSVWDGQDVIDMIGPLVGREGRGEAHRRLPGGRQVHRRERRCDPAHPVRAADRLRRQGQGRRRSVSGAVLPYLMKPA